MEVILSRFLFSNHQELELRELRNNKEILQMVGSEQNLERSVARDDDSSNAAGFIKNKFTFPLRV